MKKRLGLLFIITLLLLAASLYLVYNNNSKTIHDKSSEFAISDTSNVSKIFLTDKKNRSILLSRKEDGLWRVNDTHIARSDAIEFLLDALLRVEVREPVAKAAHNNTIRRLSSTGIKVEVYQLIHRIRIGKFLKLFPREKLSKVYYVGGATQDNTGTYMLLEGADQPYITYIKGFTGFLSPRYSTQLNDWREHIIFNDRLSDIKSLEVSFPSNPQESYRVEKNAGTLNLISTYTQKPIPLFDTLKLFENLNKFADIRFEALLTYPSPEIDTLLGEKLFEISLTNILGRKTRLSAHLKKSLPGELDLEGNPVYYDRDRMYAFINDEKDLVIIQYFIFEDLSRPLGYYTSGQVTAEGEAVAE